MLSLELTHWDPYCHTLDIKNGLLFAEGGVSLQLHRRDAALSGCVFTVGHCSIPPGSPSLYHADGGGPVSTTQRTLGGTDSFLGEHRSGGRSDIGGSVGMEGSGTGVKL